MLTLHMKNDKTVSNYLSTTQAAQRLGLSVGTVQRMVQAGVLQAYTTQGGHRRILSASLNHYCRGHTDALCAPPQVCVLVPADGPRPDASRLRQIAGLQLIANPLELVGMRHPLDVLFIDARIPWLPWSELHIADNLGTEAHCVIFNSDQLPEGSRQGLFAQATLHPGDLSADLVMGYLQGSAAVHATAPGQGRPGSGQSPAHPPLLHPGS